MVHREKGRGRRGGIQDSVKEEDVDMDNGLNNADEDDNDETWAYAYVALNVIA